MTAEPKETNQKRAKAEPKEVGLIDVLIELRELRGRIFQLEKRLSEHIESDPNRRIG